MLLPFKDFVKVLLNYGKPEKKRESTGSKSKHLLVSAFNASTC